MALRSHVDPLRPGDRSTAPAHECCWCSTTSSNSLKARRMLDRLLTACPRVKAIVTSRVRLGADVGMAAAADGSACPEDGGRRRTRVLRRGAPVRRCGAARRAGAGSRAEAAAIVDICRQVEGLPLALELAAAWTRVLSCDEIAAELRQRDAELLHAVDATQPSRHASIEVVFDQSWRLLDRPSSATCWLVCRSSTGVSRRRPRVRSLVRRCRCWVRSSDKSLLHKHEGRAAPAPAGAAIVS